MELKALRDEDKLTPDLVFRDPYLLDFLGLKDAYAEKDLEAAILREMETFILELGIGFAFMERQKRIIVDGVDHYLDLLFYHRNLHRLVAIELKIGSFQPGDKGQMELYLGWLEYFVDGLSTQLAEVKERGEMVIRRDVLVKENHLSERQVIALGYILENGSPTIKDFERLCPEVNRRSLQRDLKSMADKGLLVSKGATDNLDYQMKTTD